MLNDSHIFLFIIQSFYVLSMDKFIDEADNKERSVILLSKEHIAPYLIIWKT